MKMSRRKKSSSNGNKSNDDVAGEWSEEEKARLKDALKRDDGEDNWRWIARQVKTKTVTQVKEYASKLNTGKQSVHSRATASQQQSKSGKRPIAPKDDGPLEGWINATKRLRGENDLDGTCIPQKQNERSRSQELREPLDKNAKSANECDDDDIEENPEDEVLCNKDLNEQEGILSPERTSRNTDSKMDSVMKELLANQKQMMEKISLLQSRLDENLQSNEGFSQTLVMDMLNNINSKLTELHKSAPHGQCSGTVIIQTTPHAKVVHQPILDSSRSCSGAKKGESCSAVVSVDNSKSITNQERNDPVSSNLSGTESVASLSTGSGSSECRSTILHPDLQEPLPQSEAFALSTPSPCIYSHLSNVPSPVERSMVNTDAQPTQPEPSVPATSEIQTSSTPNRSFGLVFDQSPSITSTVNSASIPVEISAALRQQKQPVSEHGNTSSLPSQAKVTLPHRETAVSSVMVTATPLTTSLPSSYIDLHSTLTLNPPVMSTSVKSSTAAINCIPLANSTESSHLYQSTTPIMVNSTACTSAPLHKSPQDHSSRGLLHTSTTAISAQSSIPTGFITLQHPSLTLTPNKVPVPLPLHPHPQAARMTSQSPSEHGKRVSPGVGTVIMKSGNVASTKQTTALPKEILNAEHPNKEHEAQWKSCLSAIVTDCHKTQIPSRGDMQQLVSVGRNPCVTVTRFELEDLLEKSKGRAKFFALRMAERLFGMDVLIKSTPYGIGNKDALHPGILNAIKEEVVKRFGAGMSAEGQTLLWKGCVTSIAQRCKRARNPRKNRSLKGSLYGDDDLGPPSMAVEGGLLLEKQEDSQSDSEGEEEDYNMESMEQGTAKKKLPLVQIPSDDEKEESQNGSQDEVECSRSSKGPCPVLTQAKNTSGNLESSGKSSVQEGESEENKRGIPPGIDPDITVVHLPPSLRMPVEGQGKQPEKVDSSGRRHSDINTNSKIAYEVTTIKASETVSASEAQQNSCESKKKDASVVDILHGDVVQIAHSIPRLGVSPGSITVSGIKMTPDYLHVLVGGNPNVALPRQKYLDALTKSSQPTHFAVRLAELAFGDDVLVASTVTGGKRGTMQLDPSVINAIQVEVTGRFLNDLSPEQQNVVWRKCVTSIATRCKTLRYNRTKSP
ncbi:mucin-4-like isoform X2 [Montipora foliosa]|uniref:mucin-4-like isoform X2 n=1 Tax=Montipora foliosa TaxID=591990 RepID=UPI0035F20BE3